MQIDQDRRDYRAQPVKNEPIFVAGAGQKLATWIAVFCFCIGVAVVIETLFGPAIRSAAKAITAAIFS